LNSFGDLPSRTQAIFSSGRDYYIGPPTNENRLRSCRSTHTWIAWPGRMVTTRLKTRSRQEEAASNWKGCDTPQGQPPLRSSGHKPDPQQNRSPCDVYPCGHHPLDPEYRPYGPCTRPQHIFARHQKSVTAQPTGTQGEKYFSDPTAIGVYSRQSGPPCVSLIRVSDFTISAPPHSRANLIVLNRVQSQFMDSRYRPLKAPPNTRRLSAMSVLSRRASPSTALLWLFHPVLWHSYV